MSERKAAAPAADRARLRAEAEALVDARAREIEQLAGRAARNFGDREKSQINQLERLGYQAVSLAELEFHVKRQAGKDTKGKNWCKDGFAQALIEFIRGLERDLQPLMDRAPEDVRLRLPAVVAGRAMRHLFSAYLFALAQKGNARSDGGGS
ncbi:MAG: hypothetical protein D6738_14655 [Acidobacteria bacterium]|nr:MAG: hypothetical protein D6738_14655 [Acidobacteriota bacterium]